MRRFIAGLFLFAFLAPSAPASAGEPVDFRGIIERALALYRPRFAAQGVALSFVETHDDMIKGGASRDDAAHASFSFDTGYYADPKVSADGFLFAVCHELGHLVAGAPRRAAPPEYDGPMDQDADMLLSGEGQADYYAASKCMRLALDGQDNAAYLRAHPAPEALARECAGAYPDAGAAALCQRVALAGKNFLDSFAIVVPTSFEARSPERVDHTSTILPSPQCRLDTIVAGALCPVDKDAPVDGRDPAVGSCTSRDFPAGARPACWFRE